MTDVTDMSEAAFEVYVSVRAGDDVAVGHLSPAERLSVCGALGIRAPAHWLHDAPGADVPRGPRRVASDVEGMILDRQDAFYDE